MALVNLCIQDVPLLGLSIQLPVLLGIFSLSPVVKFCHLSRVLMYVPQRMLALSVYTGIVGLSGAWPAGEGVPGRMRR